MTLAGMGVPGFMWAVRALNSLRLVNVFVIQDGGGVSVDAEYLTEVDTLHTFASQCWTDRWTGTCLAGTNYELDHNIFCGGLSGHVRKGLI